MVRQAHHPELSRRVNLKLPKHDEIVKTIFSRQGAKNAKEIAHNINPPKADKGLIPRLLRR